MYEIIFIYGSTKFIYIKCSTKKSKNEVKYQIITNYPDYIIYQSTNNLNV